MRLLAGSSSAAGGAAGTAEKETPADSRLRALGLAASAPARAQLGEASAPALAVESSFLALKRGGRRL